MQGRGKTLTETAFQDIAKNRPWELEFKQPQIIVSNYLSAYTDFYIDIRPKITQVYNRFQGKDTPVLDLFAFLKNPWEMTHLQKGVEFFMTIDDIYAWLASYHFGSSINDTATSVMAGGRKKHISIQESSVRFKDVDPRIRALHTHLFLPKQIAGAGICSIERYEVDVFEDRRIKPDIYFDATAYYDKYDTEEVIESVYESGKSSEYLQERHEKRDAMIEARKPTLQAQTVAPIAGSSSEFTYVDSTPSRDWQTQGYENREKGNSRQHILVQEIMNRFYQGSEYTYNESPEEAGSGVMIPDLVVRKEGKAIAVYAIKTAETVPSSQRRQPDGTWKKNSASFRAEDLKPELTFAIENSVPCHLFIMNPLSKRIDDHLIEDPANFKPYATKADFAGVDKKRKQT